MLLTAGGAKQSNGRRSGRRRQRQRRRRPDLTRLHRKAKAALAESILPGETPLVVIHGAGNSAIIATDRRVFVFKIGVKSGTPFGYRFRDFEYESVMRVDEHRETKEGVVVIHAPLKISSCPSYWADGRDDPWRARNAIPLEPDAPRAARDVGAISDLVAEFNRRHSREREAAGQAAHEDATPTPTVLEEIAPQKGKGAKRPVVLPSAHAETCPNCGAGLRAGWQFCPRCGASAAEPGDRGRDRFLSSS
jgi:hypothetical protein